ncbi:MAG: hypothetical protein WBN70_01895 [Polyangiales bacterium]
MTKRALLHALIVTCGLLVLHGCKTNTAKDADPSPEVVLERGTAPYLPLRYNIPEGATTTSTMELSVRSQTMVTSEGEESTNAPGLRVIISSGPAVKLGNGNTRFDVRIVDATAILPEGAEAEVERDFTTGAALLRNVGGTIEVDDRGVVQRSDLNEAAKNPDLPIRLMMTIMQVRSSLARVIFPVRTVGVSGRWETRKQIQMFGFDIEQVDRYTITQRVGDELRLRVEIAESAPRQTLSFQEDGVEFELESLSVTARGDLAASFDTLEASGWVEGQATEVFSVKRDGRSERVELDSMFRIDIAVEQGSADTRDP